MSAAGAPGPPEEGRPGPDVRLLPVLATAWTAAWWGTGAGTGTAGAWPVVRAAVVLLALLLVLLTACLGGAVAARRRRTAGRGGAPADRAASRTASRTASRPARVVAAAGLAASAAAVVLAATAAHCLTRDRPPLPAWAAERAVVEVRARVTGDARPIRDVRPGRPEQFVLEVAATSVTGRGRTARVDAAVVIIGGAPWRPLSAGQSVVVVGRLRPADPGEAAVAVVTAQGGPREVTAGSWPWRLADRLRAGLRAACAGLGADPGGLLPSLVVGDTGALPDQLRTHLQTAGLTHVTAVSGANVAIAAGAAGWLVALVGAGRRARLVLTALVLAGFVVVARPQPSVLRAAAMGAVALTGLLTGRPSRGVPVLASAGLVLLVLDPWLARSAGFALSCLATAGLLLLAPPWARSLARLLPRPLAVAVAAPAAAQVVCGPVVVLLQPSVSLYGVLANLLAEPAVAPATVLGLVAAGLSPVCPPAAGAVAWVAGLATGWIALVAHRVAAAPYALVPWPPGVAGAALQLVGTVVLVLVTVRPARRWAARWWPTRRADESPGGGRGGEPRTTGRRRHIAGSGAGAPRRVAPALVVLVAAVLGWWLGPRLAHRQVRWPPPDWVLAQCDVGQGAALVARSGVDRGVLVDAGPDPGLIDRCLRRLGVRQLDLVVLTHFHADHVDGLPGAVARRAVHAVLVSPLAEPAGNAAAVSRRLAAARIEERAGWAGMAGTAGEGRPGGWSVAWRLLAPVEAPARPAGHPEGGRAGGADDGTAVNEASLAYLLDVHAPRGVLRVVGMGDLEAPGQQRLLTTIAGGPQQLGAPADVVEVAHHGSARQDAGLYAALGARVALVGVGAGNDYGHPSPSALTMLRHAGELVVRTDTAGGIALAVRPDGALGLVTGRAPPADGTRG